MVLTDGSTLRYRPSMPRYLRDLRWLTRTPCVPARAKLQLDANELLDTSGYFSCAILQPVHVDIQSSDDAVQRNSNFSLLIFFDGRTIERRRVEQSHLRSVVMLSAMWTVGNMD